MLVFDGAKILDSQVIKLVDFLQEGDVMVFNNAKVINAKLWARIKRSGSEIEFNLDQEIAPKLWRAIIKGAKKIKDNDILEITDDFNALVKQRLEDGFVLIEFLGNDIESKLEKYGAVPLPPYIKRDDKQESDIKNYQTIYAKDGNAVAAPTAGLHFTDMIFSLLDEKKIKKAFVTLNVGAGTFLPVRSETLQEHKMHEESFYISQENANIINQAKMDKRRVVAVGTTSLRVLESVANIDGFLQESKAKTDIFIYPPYRFKVVDILMTNFHLPKSTLFMLISAFVGKDKARQIYSHAIKNQYRFYSYGDTSLLFRANLL